MPLHRKPFGEHGACLPPGFRFGVKFADDLFEVVGEFQLVSDRFAVERMLSTEPPYFFFRNTIRPRRSRNASRRSGANSTRAL